MTYPSPKHDPQFPTTPGDLDPYRRGRRREKGGTIFERSISEKTKERKKKQKKKKRRMNYGLINI